MIKYEVLKKVLILTTFFVGNIKKNLSPAIGAEIMRTLGYCNLKRVFFLMINNEP